MIASLIIQNGAAKATCYYGSLQHCYENNSKEMFISCAFYQFFCQCWVQHCYKIQLIMMLGNFRCKIFVKVSDTL